MNDQELLEAMRLMIQQETAQIIDKRLVPMQADISGIKDELVSAKDEVSGIKVILDVDIRRDINLLAEGHEMILERLPIPAEVESVDTRLSAVEIVVKKHNKEIQDLKKAQ